MPTVEALVLACREAGGTLCVVDLPSSAHFARERSREAAIRRSCAPGCGDLIRVRGTNGGLMRCGARLRQLDGTVAPYVCDRCRYVPDWAI